MNAQDFRSLQEAYNQVHQVDEDAGIVSGLVGLALGAKGALHAARKTKRLRDYPKNFVKGIADPRTYVPKKKKEEQKEQVDIYDLILSHLLDEGYAETPEAAEAIMVNMSEEWRESICEAEIEPPKERVGALTNINIPMSEREAARQRTLAKAKAKREKNKN
jgi:hypothetical protein